MRSRGYYFSSLLSLLFLLSLFSLLSLLSRRFSIILMFAFLMAESHGIRWFDSLGSQSTTISLSRFESGFDPPMSQITWQSQSSPDVLFNWFFYISFQLLQDALDRIIEDSGHGAILASIREQYSRQKNPKILEGNTSFIVKRWENVFSFLIIRLVVTHTQGVSRRFLKSTLLQKIQSVCPLFLLLPICIISLSTLSRNFPLPLSFPCSLLRSSHFTTIQISSHPQIGQWVL